MRKDLVNTAVSFLKDAKVQSAPMEKRIAFLESKGLTKEEIDEAIVRMKDVQSQPDSLESVPSPSDSKASMQPSISVPPPLPKRSPQSYLFPVVAFAGISIAAYPLIRLLERIQHFVMDKDTKEMDQKLSGLDSEISATCAEAKRQSEEIQSSVDQVKALLLNLKSNQLDQRLDDIKSEVELLKDSLPKFIETSKVNANSMANDLSKEIKSLKTLLSCKPETQTIFPEMTPPQLPTWQLDLIKTKDQGLTVED